MCVAPSYDLKSWTELKGRKEKSTWAPASPFSCLLILHGRSIQLPAPPGLVLCIPSQWTVPSKTFFHYAVYCQVFCLSNERSNKYNPRINSIFFLHSLDNERKAGISHKAFRRLIAFPYACAVCTSGVWWEWSTHGEETERKGQWPDDSCHFIDSWVLSTQSFAKVAVPFTAATALDWNGDRVSLATTL